MEDNKFVSGKFPEEVRSEKIPTTKKKMYEVWWSKSKCSEDKVSAQVHKPQLRMQEGGSVMVTGNGFIRTIINQDYAVIQFQKPEVLQDAFCLFDTCDLLMGDLTESASDIGLSVVDCLDLNQKVKMHESILNIYHKTGDVPCL